MYGVILAGGSGTRFWPVSRERYPKQLQKIAGSKTMIQNTVERILPLIPVDRVSVVTNELHAFETCKQLAGLGFDGSRLLAEPVGRNTAPAIGLAARVLMAHDPEAVMAVFPADHVVQDPENFLDALRVAETAALKGRLVTLGVEPSRPETGYGYIKKGPPLEDSPGAFRVERFVEKPGDALARQYIEEGGYLWNCGVFIWKASVLLDEIRAHLPELFPALETAAGHLRETTGHSPYRILDQEGQEIYAAMSSISIDYGVMEKSANIAIVPASMNWSDVGSWSALREIGDQDAAGNILDDNVVSIDSEESIIQGNGRLIAAVGIRNLIIVDTPDALLVCDRNRAQDVKKVVEKIKKECPAQAEIHTTVQKPWGSYTVLEKRDRYLVKTIEVLPGEKLSLQSHHHRSEHWTVVCGQAEVERDGETAILQTDESVYIPQGCKHRLGNPGKTLLKITEIQIGGKIDEDDIVRYQDRYGRGG